jgi:hypothetical protein
MVAHREGKTDATVSPPHHTAMEACSTMISCHSGRTEAKMTPDESGAELDAARRAVQPVSLEP